MIDLTTYALCRKYIYDNIIDINILSFKVVEELPEQGKTKYIYLVPKGQKTIKRLFRKATVKNIYTEYIWLETENRFEELGTTDMDLDEYIKNDEIESKIHPV